MEDLDQKAGTTKSGMHWALLIVALALVGGLGYVMGNTKATKTVSSSETSNTTVATNDTASQQSTTQPVVTTSTVTPEKALIENYVRFMSPYGYEIQYPKDWEVSTSDSVSACFYAKGWRDGLVEGGKGLCVLPSRTTLDAYKAEQAAQQAQYSWLGIKDEKSVVVGGVSATQFMIGTDLGPEFPETFIARDDISYVITHDSSDTIHKQMLETFRLTELSAANKAEIK